MALYYDIIISTGEGNTPRANAGAQVDIGEAKKFQNLMKLGVVQAIHPNERL